MPRPTLARHSRIRDQIGPMIRAVGIRETARRSGIAQPSISAWLAGRRPMSAPNIELIALAIGARITVSFA